MKICLELSLFVLEELCSCVFRRIVLKYLKFYLRNRFPKLVTDIKILCRKVDQLTLHLAVVLSDTYGGADKASIVLKLDKLSVGKIVTVILILFVLHKSHREYSH
jgi:hypothetical protein